MKNPAGIRIRALGLAFCILCTAFPGLSAGTRELFETKPSGAYFDLFEPLKAPASSGPYLQPDDRLALCGDSITQQKMYTRIMETYLTVCHPQLRISVRQYGWSGETAERFLRRMENDCLRFKPTVATTSYGMNDYRYCPYSEAIGNSYRDNYSAVVRKFKEAGARVVLGSPGCVGKVASWVKTASGTLDEHNQSLCRLRNIGIGIAQEEKVRFADHFWPMLTADVRAQKEYGPDYAVAGKDGVHPGWAGHLLMAYTYLNALGLNPEIGSFNVDMQSGKAEVSEGHALKAFRDGILTIESRRYPFCAAGAPDKDDSIRSGMQLVPFNRNLNRLTLVIRNGDAAGYKVTWGETARTYTREELSQGVNLANDFEMNPFSGAFSRVDEAVAAKQAYETKQIMKIFHGPEGEQDMEAAVEKSEAERAQLVSTVSSAFVPVTHSIHIEAL